MLNTILKIYKHMKIYKKIKYRINNINLFDQEVVPYRLIIQMDLHKYEIDILCVESHYMLNIIGYNVRLFKTVENNYSIILLNSFNECEKYIKDDKI